MTYERWITLPYPEQKAALADSVLWSEEWEWANFATLYEFFNQSCESDLTTRRFVDISKLRHHYGSAEREDADDDMGMDTSQYLAFRQNLFTGLDIRLLESEESEDLALLGAVKSVYLSREMFKIVIKAGHEDQFVLRLSRRTFTDGRCDEEALPWAEPEEHEQFDDLGEWLEVDGESTSDFDDAQSVIDGIADVEVEVDSGLDAELAASFSDHREGDEFEVPEYEYGSNMDSKGFGDRLFQ